MVKYKSLLEKYCCNSVDGLVNTTMFSGAENMTEELMQEKSPKTDDQYVAPWRAVCDAWVTHNVLDSPGDNTPVYQLYNAYINDNPDDYMDIGQFGKVLRSRFPYRKRRRGKQGQQVYVYQDVALKNKPDSMEAPKRLTQNTTEASVQKSSSPAGPAIVIGNNSGGRLLTSSNTSDEESSAILNSSSKRMGLADSNLQLSPGLKRLKKGDEPNLIDVPSGSVIQHPNDGNPRRKYEALNTASDDEKYAISSLCRMAIGRRWIDTNLVDMPGVHTTANEICCAYADDHPEEPLTFTSLALLIRGKYPGRRRKINSGSDTKYIYQDIKLIRNSEEKYPQKRDMISAPLSGNIQDQSSSLNMGKTKGSENLHQSSHYVLLPVTGASATRDFTAFYPLKTTLFSGASNVKDQRSHSKAIVNPLVITSKANAQLMFAKKAKSLVKQCANHKLNSFSMESLLTENNDLAMSAANVSENTGIILKSIQSNQETMEQSGEMDYSTTKNPDMDVSAYLAGELLAINEMITPLQSYSVNIKIPSGNQSVCDNITNLRQFTTWRPSRELDSPNPLVMPEVTSPKRVENTDKDTEGIKSWDYEIRNNMGVSNDMILEQTKKTIIGKKTKSQNKGSNGKNRRTPKPIIEEKFDTDVEIPINYGATNECINHNQVKVSRTFMSSPNYNINYMNENSSHSITSRSSGSSPTSTSPPCPAMHRLAEEIDTQTPSVSGFSNPVSLHVLPTAISLHEERTAKQLSNINDPEFKKTFRSVILAAKQILSKHEASSEAFIETNLESSIIENNPAVYYSEPTQCDASKSEADHFTCVASSSLKDLVLRQPGHINDLLEHHQTCPGLGCSEECQTLRAAYIHLTIFRHKCQVWKTFTKIISKHSKQCRYVSCGVEFCQFVKHELHQSGVSVLPMQLMKERPTLEEEFKNCEQYGTHDGDLNCHHMRYPMLPTKISGTKRRKERDQLVNDATMDTNFILPDSPNGNAMAVPLIKTIELVKSLFQISTIPS